MYLCVYIYIYIYIILKKFPSKQNKKNILNCQFSNGRKIRIIIRIFFFKYQIIVRINLGNKETNLWPKGYYLNLKWLIQLCKHHSLFYANILGKR